MYLQMNHTDLIASTPQEYVTLVLKLFTNKTFHDDQSRQVEEKFRDNIHRNYDVLQEWLSFITRLTHPEGVK